MDHYQHKSGAQKRKEKIAREKSAKKGQSTIESFGFINCNRIDGVSEDQMCKMKSQLSNVEVEPVPIEEDELLNRKVMSADVKENVIDENENILPKTSTARLEELQDKADDVQLVPSNNYDIGLIKELFCTAEQIEKFVHYRPIAYPTKFPKDALPKSFPRTLFHIAMPNGEKVQRDWLTWSETKNALYCFPCRLFSKMPETHRSALSLPTGYSKPKDNKWKKLYEKIPHDQSSTGHKMCYTEVERWRQILRRVLNVILFLGERGLAFRGDSHLIGDPKNGNFLGIMELIGLYDSILHDHLEKVKASQQSHKRMQAHYLSNDIQNEFIQCCADQVTDVILDEREKCKYFSMIVYATPDTDHIEQNVFILRYVLQNKLTGKYEVKERFLEFVDCNKKTGEDIANIITSTLQKHKIPLMCCRGQGYDNGSNMKCSVKAAQARILQHYPLATYSPCACHSLNLCGAQAAECCPQVITFFGIVQKLYNIFSSSPQRWEIKKKNIGSSFHIMSQTRWSARMDCIKSFATHLPGIIKSVADIRNLNLSIENRADLNGIISYMESFECILMSAIWFKVLTAINYTNLVLQARNATLDVEVTNIKRLIDELKTL
ncbi:zinc finger MYM-type protein 1-like [Hydra vulgaris]|uniref:zinc finger MYM-type protein 1-like n=1 Tax=Hydra vulgaris TaxID=6087 RepID=UPI001F5EB326|nr:zinc finger MYM-type protein 1-like [Hydra vulgaris]